MKNKVPHQISNSDGIVRKQPGLINLILAVSSLFVALVLLELTLRSIIPVNIRIPSEFRIPHPTLGWSLKPNTTYTYQKTEDIVNVTYNSQGFRDLEHDLSKDHDIFRILILGDSFMEGYSVELEDAFHRKIAEFISTDSINIEVLNLGVAGYGTLQEYLLFQETGQLYKPDLVLLGFFAANDLMNNSKELETMLGPDRGQGLARPYLDPSSKLWMVIPGDFESAQHRYDEQEKYLDEQRQRLTEQLVILRLARSGFTRIVDNTFGEKPQKITEVADLSVIERQELALLGVNYCDEYPEYNSAWQTTERILSKLETDIEAIGSKLVIFSVPALEEISIESYELVNGPVVYRDRLCIEEAPGQTRLSQILAALDIDFIDLLPDFRKVAKEDSSSLYYLSDQHWNSEGHSLAARIVVSELYERHLLPNAR